MDAKINNLMIRFPFATRDEVAAALKQEDNHAGRAGARLKNLDPSINGGETNGGTKCETKTAWHGAHATRQPTPLDFDLRCRWLYAC